MAKPGVADEDARKAKAEKLAGRMPTIRQEAAEALFLGRTAGRPAPRWLTTGSHIPKASLAWARGPQGLLRRVLHECRPGFYVCLTEHEFYDWELNHRGNIGSLLSGCRRALWAHDHG